MAKWKVFPQEKENTCAVASLRTVLANQFDVVVEETALEALGTDAHEPIESVGADNGDIRRMVAGASFAFNKGKRWRLTIRRRGTVKDLQRQLKRGRYPMLTVRSTDKDAPELLHMVVCLQAEVGRVRIYNPNNQHPYWMEMSKFLKWWTQDNMDREYAVISGGEHVEKVRDDSCLAGGSN